MIITRKKPPEQLLAMLAGVHRVALAGCKSCATACQTGGEKELAEMTAFLQEHGFEVVGTILPDECCHMLLVKRDIKALRDSGAEAIVGMACGDGVQMGLIQYRSLEFAHTFPPFFIPSRRLCACGQAVLR